MSERPLTEQQERRLILADHGIISTSTARSMPSLERRGLAERYRETDGGVSHVYWRITDAGRAEAQRIRERRGEAG